MKRGDDMVLRDLQSAMDAKSIGAWAWAAIVYRRYNLDTLAERMELALVRSVYARSHYSDATEKHNSSGTVTP